MIIKSYEQTFVAAIHAQSCKGACHRDTLDFLDFISILKKMIVLISLNRCGMVGVGLGKLRKGGNELSMKKKIHLAVQITIELVVVLGDSRDFVAESLYLLYILYLLHQLCASWEIHDVSGLIPKLSTNSIVI